MERDDRHLAADTKGPAPAGFRDNYQGPLPSGLQSLKRVPSDSATIAMECN